MTKYLSRILKEEEIALFKEYLSNKEMGKPPTPEEMLTKDGVERFIKWNKITTILDVVNMIGFAALELREMIVNQKSLKLKEVSLEDESQQMNESEEITDFSDANSLLKKFTLGK